MRSFACQYASAHLLCFQRIIVRNINGFDDGLVVYRHGVFHFSALIEIGQVGFDTALGAMYLNAGDSA